MNQGINKWIWINQSINEMNHVDVSPMIFDASIQKMEWMDELMDGWMDGWMDY